jgi:hypothetical protein
MTGGACFTHLGDMSKMTANILEGFNKSSRSKKLKVSESSTSCTNNRSSNNSPKTPWFHSSGDAFVPVVATSLPVNQAFVMPALFSD